MKNLLLIATLTLPSLAIGGVGVPNSHRHLLWPNGRVPYVMGNVHDQQVVLDAIAEFHNKTHVRFVPRTSQANYVVFAGAPDDGSQCSWGGTTSWWYMLPGEQILSLGEGCTAANWIHELAHLIGVYHEQQHPNRDNHIIVHFSEIIPGFESFFEIAPVWNPPLPPGQGHTPFDFDSIMLYHPFAYAVGANPTITKKDGSLYTPGFFELSAGDVATINKMYPRRRFRIRMNPTSPVQTVIIPRP